MSICTPCTKTLPVAYCSDSVHVGDWIAGSGQTVEVYMKNTATGAIQHEQITTGVSGKMSIATTVKMAGSSYEVWVNSSTGQMNEQEAFYLPDTTTSVDCVSLEFERATTSGSAMNVTESKLESA